MTKSRRVEGIIVKRVNVGEADRILTVMTREIGKIQVKAIGIRRITSRRSPHVELLNRVSLSLFKGHTMYILTEAVVLDTYEYIKTDLSKVGFAYHICELVNGLIPEGQENPQLYGMLTYCLGKALREEDLSKTVHRFEMKLLAILGFWPEGKELGSSQSSYMIENILERRLKSRQIIPQLL